MTAFVCKTIAGPFDHYRIVYDPDDQIETQLFKPGETYPELKECIKAEQIQFRENGSAWSAWKTAKDFETQRIKTLGTRKAEHGKNITLTNGKRARKAVWEATTKFLSAKMTGEMYDHNSTACIERIKHCKQMIAIMERP
jgi:hypothetical protein